MRIQAQLLLALLVCIVGCSDSGDSSNSGPDLGSDLSLAQTDGTEISAESLGCFYSQNIGADSALSLQLQFLSTANSVAFALYIEDPIPATPYMASAGQEGRFTFEVFTENVSYRDDLFNSEVEIRLDELHSPSTLTNGDVVSLKV